jgi:hypothetical protein
MHFSRMEVRPMCPARHQKLLFSSDVWELGRKLPASPKMCISLDYKVFNTVDRVS